MRASQENSINLILHTNILSGNIQCFQYHINPSSTFQKKNPIYYSNKNFWPLKEEISYCLTFPTVRKDRIIIWCKFFFLFIGWKLTPWPANNCLQIMVRSCAMSSNCVWLQMTFCSCINKTMIFSFLRLFLHEKWQITSLPEKFIKNQTW